MRKLITVITCAQRLKTIHKKEKGKGQTFLVGIRYRFFQVIWDVSLVLAGEFGCDLWDGGSFSADAIPLIASTHDTAIGIGIRISVEVKISSS